jgi:hypothetical protein
MTSDDTNRRRARQLRKIDDMFTAAHRAEALAAARAITDGDWDEQLTHVAVAAQARLALIQGRAVNWPATAPTDPALAPTDPPHEQR